MIAFGTLVGDDAKYERWAGRGVERTRETSSVVLQESGARSIAAGYNTIIERARGIAGLEALVLLHEDTEITDPQFCAKVRERLKDGSIGLLGVIGARNVSHVSYWTGDVKGAVEEPRGVLDGGRGFHDVDAIDGLLMILSPWAVDSVRFDAVAFDAFHGYDVDYSFAVRSAGRRVVVDDLSVFHHTKGAYGDFGAYLRASRAWRRKWLSEAPRRVRFTSWTHDARLWCRVRLRRYPRLRAMGRATVGAVAGPRAVAGSRGDAEAPIFEPRERAVGGGHDRRGPK